LTGLITTSLELYCGTAGATITLLINSWWCQCGQRWRRVSSIRLTGICITIIITPTVATWRPCRKLPWLAPRRPCR